MHTMTIEKTLSYLMEELKDMSNDPKNFHYTNIKALGKILRSGYLNGSEYDTKSDKADAKNASWELATARHAGRHKAESGELSTEIDGVKISLFTDKILAAVRGIKKGTIAEYPKNGSQEYKRLKRVQKEFKEDYGKGMPIYDIRKGSINQATDWVEKNLNHLDSRDKVNIAKTIAAFNAQLDFFKDELINREFEERFISHNKQMIPVKPEFMEIEFTKIPSDEFIYDGIPTKIVGFSLSYSPSRTYDSYKELCQTINLIKKSNVIIHNDMYERVMEKLLKAKREYEQVLDNKNYVYKKETINESLNEELKNIPAEPKNFHYTNLNALYHILKTGRLKSTEYEIKTDKAKDVFDEIATVRDAGKHAAEGKNAMTLSLNIDGIRFSLFTDRILASVRGMRKEPIAELPKAEDKENYQSALKNVERWKGWYGCEFPKDRKLCKQSEVEKYLYSGAIKDYIKDFNPNKDKQFVGELAARIASVNRRLRDHHDYLYDREVEERFIDKFGKGIPAKPELMKIEILKQPDVSYIESWDVDNAHIDNLKRAVVEFKELTKLMKNSDPELLVRNFYFHDTIKRLEDIILKLQGRINDIESGKTPVKKSIPKWPDLPF